MKDGSLIVNPGLVPFLIGRIVVIDALSPIYAPRSPVFQKQALVQMALDLVCTQEGTGGIGHLPFTGPEVEIGKGR